MKKIRMGKARLKQVKKWCSRTNHEPYPFLDPTVEAGYWLHSVINAVQDGITVMDSQYNILLQNETTRQLYKGMENSGEPCYKIHYGSNEPCDHCHAMEAMKTGRLIKKNQPFQGEGPSGQTFEVYAYPISDNQGAAIGVVEYLRDITELKKREEELQQSESRYESILDATNTGVWEYDSHRQMERLSATYFTYLGYDPAKFTDEEGFTNPAFFRGIIHPEDRDQEMRGFKQYLDDGSPGIYENTFRIQKQDGTWVWMMSRGKTLRNKAGKPTHITLGTMTDITQQIRFERQIDSINSIGLLANSTLELDKVLHSILESATRLVNTSVGMIFIKDPKTGLFKWGASQGLSEDFVLAFKEKPIAPGDGLTGTIAQTGKIIYIPMESSTDPRITRSIVHKEGLNSFLGVPIIAGDEIIGVMNILTRPPMQLSDHDMNLISIVSGQVGLAIRNAQLYNQQKEKERESSLLISQMQLGLALHEVICDETGSPVDYRFLSVNDSFERITGLSREALIGNTVLEVLPNTEAYWIQSFGNVALTGISRQFENYSTELGKYFQVNAYSPQHQQFAVIVDDVTEKRMTALRLTLAKEEAEAANKAKTQFLANMSHELRTPLNGLMGMLQLLQGTTLSEEQQEYIQIALGGSQSLTRVVEDILNYTNLEKSIQKIIEEPFQLEGLLQEVTELHQTAAVHKGLFLSAHTDRNLPNQVMGDRFRLKQILGNLVGNAVKFTETGMVQLLVKQAGGETTDGRINICFQVKDTGIGVPQEKMEYIFQRFSQVDESHTRVYGGLGLGLTVAKEQTALLGGSLTAESVPGEGSTFTLICEVGVAKGLQPATSPFELGDVYYPQTAFGDIQVLVVDDDYSSRLMAELHLKKMGCQVETTTNGQTALEKLAEKEYHLVFMDCQMPVMDGYEATRRIREIEKEHGGHTPIIAMTAKVLPGDREKCLEAGMDGFLAKPIEVERLKAAIGNFANNEWNGEKPLEF